MNNIEDDERVQFRALAKRYTALGIHSSARALHKIGAIDKTTLRGFDASCLAVPVEIQPEQIKQIRELNRVSGIALKLLSVIQKHGLKVLA